MMVELRMVRGDEFWLMVQLVRTRVWRPFGALGCICLTGRCATRWCLGWEFDVAV